MSWTTESCYLAFQIVMNVMANGTQPVVLNCHLREDLFIYFKKAVLPNSCYTKPSGYCYLCFDRHMKGSELHRTKQHSKKNKTKKHTISCGAGF